MELALTIVSALVTIAGLGYKIWSQRQAVAKIEATLALETKRADEALRALDKVKSAGVEKDEHAKRLEASLRAHLKTCGTPLAGWANSLWNDKDS